MQSNVCNIFAIIVLLVLSLSAGVWGGRYDVDLCEAEETPGCQQGRRAGALMQIKMTKPVKDLSDFDKDLISDADNPLDRFSDRQHESSGSSGAHARGRTGTHKGGHTGGAWHADGEFGSESAPETAPEPIPEPTPEPASEPAFEPTPEPTPEPASESALEPTSDPAPGPAPEPADKSPVGKADAGPDGAIRNKGTPSIAESAVLPNETASAKNKKGKKCTTRLDARASSWGYTTAVPGTPCLFGVDVRDEGKHCIMEDKYGSFGWCWTSKDLRTFGSCSEDCPLSGPERIIGDKIKEVKTELNKMLKVATKTAALVNESLANASKALTLAKASKIQLDRMNESLESLGNASKASEGEPAAEGPDARNESAPRRREDTAPEEEPWAKPGSAERAPPDAAPGGARARSGSEPTEASASTEAAAPESAPTGTPAPASPSNESGSKESSSKESGSKESSSKESSSKSRGTDDSGSRTAQSRAGVGPTKDGF